MPSMHLPGLLHHRKKSNAEEREALASPVHENYSINTEIKVLLQVQFLKFNKNNNYLLKRGLWLAPAKV